MSSEKNNIYPCLEMIRTQLAVLHYVFVIFVTKPPKQVRFDMTYGRFKSQQKRETKNTKMHNELYGSQTGNLKTHDHECKEFD